MGAETGIAGNVPLPGGLPSGPNPRRRRQNARCTGPVFTRVNDLFSGLYNPVDRLNDEVGA